MRLCMSIELAIFQLPHTYFEIELGFQNFLNQSELFIIVIKLLFFNGAVKVLLSIHGSKRLLILLIKPHFPFRLITD